MGINPLGVRTIIRRELLAKGGPAPIEQPLRAVVHPYHMIPPDRDTRRHRRTSFFLGRTATAINVYAGEEGMDWNGEIPVSINLLRPMNLTIIGYDQILSRISS